VACRPLGVEVELSEPMGWTHFVVQERQQLPKQMEKRVCLGVGRAESAPPLWG